MLNCLVCSSSFSLNATSSKLCPVCLKQVLQEKAYCQECSRPLDLSSSHCRHCRHRHGMSNCGFCQYELFKHAAISATRQYVMPEDPLDPFLTRLWKRVNPTKIKKTLFYHRYCVQTCPTALDGASNIQQPDLPSGSMPAPIALSHDVQLDEDVQPISMLAPEPLHHVATEVPSNPSQSPSLFLEDQNADDEPPELASTLFDAQDYQGNDAPLISPLSDIDAESDSATSETESDSASIAFIHEYQLGRRDFSSVHYPNSVHEDVSLAGIDLKGADISGAIWARVDLSQANLISTQCNQANLREINFKGAALRYASFREAQIFLSNFSASDLSQADLSGSDFYASYFHRSYLTDANLAQAKLDATDFSWAYLANANLEETSLVEAILEGANLENTRLVASDLTWANLEDACFVGANLNDANFHHAKLKGADFSGAQFINADLSQTNLAEASSLCQAQYSEQTQFPLGFDPDEQAMSKV